MDAPAREQPACLLLFREHRDAMRPTAMAVETIW